jgi:leader peptidase (prepilin peptidase)/N-methyltransferase
LRLAAFAGLWQSGGVAPLIVFLFGLMLGSFLNVCIVRIQRGESIVAPPSHCPHCGGHIRPWDNIPVVSYLLLHGRCRSCETPISPLYPTVELLIAILAAGCYLSFGLSPMFAKWLVFCALNVMLIFTDLRERILPDAVNFAGLTAGLLASLFVTVPATVRDEFSDSLAAASMGARIQSLEAALVGAACGGGVLWLFAEGYFRLHHKEGMGLGDVKMMLMAGSFLGWKGVLLTILAGSVMGSVIGLSFLAIGRRGRDYEWPFGAFLGVAAIAVAFWGPRVIAWYLSYY